MSNEMITMNQQNDLGSQMLEIENTSKMCQSLMKTKHYQKMGEEGVFAIISKARSLGMNALEALNGGLYFVQGKVGMSTESMAALIRQRGHSIIKDTKSDNSNCILHGRRSDNGDTWTVSFSVEDAKRAGLMKNMYDKYPGTMLYNRAMSTLARQLFPDIIRGAGYTLDELHEIAQNKNHDQSNLRDYQTLDAHVEQVIEKTISKEQSIELKSIFDECDPDFKKNILEELKNSKYKVQSWSSVPDELFEKLKKVGIQNAEKYQSELAKADIEALEQTQEIEVAV